MRFTLKPNSKGLTDLYYGKHKIAKNLENEELLDLGLSITKNNFDNDLLEDLAIEFGLEMEIVEELAYEVFTLEDLLDELDDYREFYVIHCDDIDY